MDLRRLHNFVVLAGELHFTRAAERLQMSQPALSLQMAKLEAELGVKLFRRTGRNAQLTSAGSAFLDSARLVLANADDAKIAAQRAERGETGRLSVSVAPDIAYAVLPSLVREYLRASPGVRLSLVESWSVDQVAALHAGVVDVGLLHLPIDDRGLSVRALRRDPLIIALPKRHALARRRKIGLVELASELWVRIPPQPRAYGRDRFLEMCRQVGFEPRIVAEAGQIYTLLRLVAEGVGVCMLPAAVRWRSPVAGVTYHAIAGGPMTGDTAVVWRVGGERLTMLSGFLGVVERLLRQD